MKFSLFLFLFLMTAASWAKWSVSAYNIRNFDKDPGAGKVNLVELQKMITSVESDVMSFEEVVNLGAFKELMAKVLPTYKYVVSSCGGFGQQHLAVAYNPKTFKFINSAEDMTFSGASSTCGSLRPAFLVSLEQKSTQKMITFIAVHLKAGGDDRAFSQRWGQYEKLVKLARTYGDKRDVILMGDFNSTGYNIKDEDYTHFEEFLTNAGLRTMSETLGCTSYWAGNQGGSDYQPSILDHIVLQDKNVADVQEVKVGAHCAKTSCRPSTPAALGTSFQEVSDHCPVQVTFK